MVVEVGLVDLAWVKTGLSGGLLAGGIDSTILRKFDICVPGEAR